MSDRHDLLDRLLQDLVKETGAVGAALVSRDGLAVKTAGAVEMARETFSAMAATLLGAAEIALGEIHGGKPQSIVCTGDRVRLVLTGATSELLLVVALRPDADAQDLLRHVETAAANVGGIVAG